MPSTSDHAELSTLRSQLDDLAQRVVAVADHYRDTPDSAIMAELDATERSLGAALRTLARATSIVEPR
ncbi:MAG TPA: hypothetical protein VIC35_04430 [Acidimicrobiia bacterium]|jgi:hypothetical protein